MAFRDENGKITIDEIAAQQDVRNLNRSKENLVSSVNYCKEILAIASEFSGSTGTVITESAIMLQKQIENAIQNIDVAVQNIDSTVKKYQAIDSELRDMIRGAKQ